MEAQDLAIGIEHFLGSPDHWILALMERMVLECLVRDDHFMEDFRSRVWLQASAGTGEQDRNGFEPGHSQV